MKFKRLRDGSYEVSHENDALVGKIEYNTGWDEWKFHPTCGYYDADDLKQIAHKISWLTFITGLAGIF
jgi:hypothetical protein